MWLSKQAMDYLEKKFMENLGVHKENNSLSWDGNAEGKTVIMGVMVRVSAKPFGLSQVETVTVCNPKTGDIVEGGTEYLALVEDGPLSMLVVDATQPRVAVCTEEHYSEQYGATIPVGVYFFNSETLRVVAIKCTETIHPIDQKYLPGVCLPVVEITSAVYPAPGGNPVFLSEAEGSALTEASDMGIPCIIKFTANVDEADIPIIGVFFRVNSAYAIPFTGDYSFTFSPVENYWVMGG